MTNVEYVEKALELLARIAAALEANTVTGTAAETPPRPSSEALPVAQSMAVSTPAPVPSHTYDEICDAINAYADRHGIKAAKEKLVSEFGAAYFKAVKPEQYAAVLKAFA
jgi:hypothetical protein